MILPSDSAHRHTFMLESAEMGHASSVLTFGKVLVQERHVLGPSLSIKMIPVIGIGVVSISAGRGAHSWDIGNAAASYNPDVTCACSMTPWQFEAY